MPEYIPTQAMDEAVEFMDKIVAQICQCHAHGSPLGVERLTMMMLLAADGVDKETIIQQQALMLAVAMQRLAIR